MSQKLRTLAAIVEDLGSIPVLTWKLTTTYNSNPKRSDVFFWLPRVLHACGTHIYTQAKHSNTENIFKRETNEGT